MKKTVKIKKKNSKRKTGSGKRQKKQSMKILKRVQDDMTRNGKKKERGKVLKVTHIPKKPAPAEAGVRDDMVPASTKVSARLAEADGRTPPKPSATEREARAGKQDDKKEATSSKITFSNRLPSGSGNIVVGEAKVSGITDRKKEEGLPQINKKLIVYYGLGAFTLLLSLRLIASELFLSIVDFSISFFPMAVIVAMAARGYFVFHKHHQSYAKSGIPLSEKETLIISRRIRREIIMETLGLLLITLLFYVLYSPDSWYPVIEAFGSFGDLLELDNFFLIATYFGVLYIVGAVMYVAYKHYQENSHTSPRQKAGYSSPEENGLKSPLERGGSPKATRGVLPKLIHSLIYRTFAIFFSLFAFSALAYPGAYSPITEFVAESFRRNGIYAVPTGDQDNILARLSKALTKTGSNLSSSIVKTNTDLTTDLKDTKDKLDNSITQANKDLKTSLEQQITTKTIVVEGRLVVTDTSTTQDIMPESNTAFDLGSSSKSWNSLYIHQLHGASAVTIGSSGSSHGVNATDDLVVSGDAEVKGTLYVDKALDMASNKIVNLAAPAADNDAANKTYVDNLIGAAAFIQRSGSTISPTNSGDSLDMKSGGITNIGSLGFADANGTTVSAGTLAVTTASIGTGIFTNLSVATTPSANTAAANKLYVDTQLAAKDAFIELNDTPHTYTGSSGKFLKSDGSGLAFAAMAATDILTGNFDVALMPTSGNWNLTGDLNVESNTFYIDQTHNRVGIGTGSPNEALEVSGNIRTSGTYKIGTQQVLSLGAGALAGNIIVGDGGGGLTHGSGYEGYYNTFLGIGTGSAGTIVAYNTIIGYAAGAASTSSFNTFVGSNAGSANTTGASNLAIGYAAQVGSTGQNNISIAHEAQQQLTSGSFNIGIGNLAGRYNQTGGANIAIGYRAGMGATGNSYSNNTFIGYMTGYSVTTGSGNLFGGYQAGYSTTTGNNNLFVGYQAGYKVTTGGENVFLGSSSGYNVTTAGNLTFVGKMSGYNNTSGLYNNFFGNYSGYSNTTGQQNVFMGDGSGQNTNGNFSTIVGAYAGYYNQTGGGNVIIGSQSGYGASGNSYSNNTFIGYRSGFSNTTGNNNFFGGYQAGYSTTTGGNNVALGYQAGYTNATGVGNVLLGYQAGYYETGSNKLFIDNAARASEADARTKALVYGIFDAATTNQSMTINGALVVGAPTGGNKGEGTINATAVYDDNVLLTDYVFDKYYDGQVKVEDQLLHGDYNIMDINQMAEYTKQNRHLPTIPGRDDWQKSGKFSLGKLTNHLWETAETQALYVTELNDINKNQDLKITDLDSRLRGNDTILVQVSALNQKSTQDDSRITELENTIAKLNNTDKIHSEGGNKKIEDKISQLEDETASLKKEITALKSEKDETNSNSNSDETSNDNSSNLVVSDNQETTADNKDPDTTIFDKIVTFVKQVVFKVKVVFLGKVEFGDHVKFNKDAAGYATIKAGKKSIDVAFKNAYENKPVTTATPRTLSDFGPYRVTDESAKGFTIEIKSEQEKDVDFAWTAIETGQTDGPDVPSN